MRRPFFALAFLAALGASTFAQSSPVPSASPSPAAITDGFSTEGGEYLSTATATGQSAQEAESNAREAALHGLFAALGKDGLFAEVFTASPPIDLTFQLLRSARDGTAYKDTVRLKVDDESISIIQQGPYLATAIGLLDKAEALSSEAEARKAEAAKAEANGDLGSALSQYGQAVDACRSSLSLIDPVADPSVFSSKGKRTAPEIKKGLASLLSEAQAGADRAQKAEAALEADAIGAAASKVADQALAEADKSQALLDEIKGVLGDLSASNAEKLSSIRDRIAGERRYVADSAAALKRAQASLPKEGEGVASIQLDFARRRLATSDGSLAAAYRSVDQEIRDPASARAARAEAIRWALLHHPREYVSARAYLPFAIETGEGGLVSENWGFRLGLEGAFPMGSGGVWARTRLDAERTDIDTDDPIGDQQSLTQSFDFGFWGKSLVFAGYRWDWLRHVDEVPYPKTGAIELGVGGVYGHDDSGQSFRRADWLFALSYELPYASSEFRLWNVANLGVDAQFRLGDLALVEASVAKRLDQIADDQYVSVFIWSLGLGLRLPPPFTVGAEFYGTSGRLDDGGLGEALDLSGGRFRFYLQYSL
jgi:hypothetical protein